MLLHLTPPWSVSLHQRTKVAETCLAAHRSSAPRPRRRAHRRGAPSAHLSRRRWPRSSCRAWWPTPSTRCALLLLSMQGACANGVLLIYKPALARRHVCLRCRARTTRCSAPGWAAHRLHRCAWTVQRCCAVSSYVAAGSFCWCLPTGSIARSPGNQSVVRLVLVCSAARQAQNRRATPWCQTRQL